MLIYAKHYGQMCNRLWSLLPSLAYAIEKKKKLYVFFASKDIVEGFLQLQKCHYVKFLFASDCPPKWAWRVTHFSEVNHLEIEGDLRNKSSIPWLSFIDGWCHSGDSSFIKEHRETLSALFQPSEIVKKKIYSSFRNFDDIIVGIHVRRGDYKEYLGGKYYYDDEAYGNQILNIKSQIESQGKRCRFLICSNEYFDWKYLDVDIIRIPDSDGVTDLYGLCMCNYIIGPPSSFSQWASFIGHVPVTYMLSADNFPTLNDFSPISRFNVFENGRTLKYDSDEQNYILQ